MIKCEAHCWRCHCQRACPTGIALFESIATTAQWRGAAAFVTTHPIHPYKWRETIGHDARPLTHKLVRSASL